jgi:hypothetical protein
MLTGSHRGERVGACTDCRRYWARYRAGEVDEVEKDEVNDRLVASVGTCSGDGYGQHHGLYRRGIGNDGARWRLSACRYC